MHILDLVLKIFHVTKRTKKNSDTYK